jgi:hypothetical protein
MNTIKQYTANLVIPAGSFNVTKNFQLPEGFVVRGVAFSNGVLEKNGATLELAFKDDGNIDIIPSINLENWKQRNGGDYLNSMKPIGLETMSRDYKLVLTSDQASDGTSKVQVAFIYG